ncbi:MAG TPA: hypothetical protein VN446_00210 [Candidatus Acidoferrum sp.]|nr:hypothetical protein [Candidatus Acidoferrum sp.]
MNLKEAFRFQNKLQALMEEAQAILSRDQNVTRVQNTYLRKKVMAEAEDETTVEVPATEYADRITDVAYFLLSLFTERELLAKAIRAAKDALPIDMDGEISLNGKRREIVRLFRHMADLRSSEVVIPGGGTGYRFNAEGNQVPYRCDVRRVITINFDRNKIRKSALDMDRKSDLVSAELDSCLINSHVDYNASFNVNSSFSEVFEAYAEGRAGI